MRRLLSILVVCIAMLHAQPAVAQTHYKAHTYVGGHAGMTMSDMSFSPSVPQSFAMGYMFGASFTYAEERHVGLRVELNVEQRGWKENFDEYKDLFSYSRHLTYISVPVMTHIFFGGRKVKCIVNLGPEFSYMLSDKISANFDYLNPEAVPGFPTRNRHNEQLYMPVKNKFDYGITAGLGAQYNVNTRNAIQLEARFYFGLGNIYSASKKDVFSASRNISLSFTAAYLFRLR